MEMSRKLDPRVKRTKRMFEEALIELLEEKEYNRITVQEITKKSTLNRATFYLHYYDKNELLEQCLDSALNDLSESVKMQEYEFTYNGEQPHPTFVRLLEKMMENRRFYKIMLAEEKIPYFTERVAGVIEELVEQGQRFLQENHIEQRIPLPIVKSYIASAYLGVIIWWLKNDMPYTPVYMSTQLTIMSTVGSFVDNPYLKKLGK
jgi:AcrR family transcriptional regulator